MLTALFVSCSDDNNDPGNGNKNSTIDERILGKWKVEYSKSIKPAAYNETTGKPDYNEKKADITEYFGNFGEPNIVPQSGMFDSNEYKIEINKNNTIISTRANNIPTKTIYYKIENGNLYWVNKPLKPNEGGNVFSYEHKYKFENGKLTIERMPTSSNFYEYAISEYSKITE